MGVGRFITVSTVVGRWSWQPYGVDSFSLALGAAFETVGELYAAGADTDLSVFEPAAVAVNVGTVVVPTIRTRCHSSSNA